MQNKDRDFRVIGISPNAVVTTRYCDEQSAAEDYLDRNRAKFDIICVYRRMSPVGWQRIRSVVKG